MLQQERLKNNAEQTQFDVGEDSFNEKPKNPNAL